MRYDPARERDSQRWDEVVVEILLRENLGATIERATRVADRKQATDWVVTGADGSQKTVQTRVRYERYDDITVRLPHEWAAFVRGDVTEFVVVYVGGAPRIEYVYALVEHLVRSAARSVDRNYDDDENGFKVFPLSVLGYAWRRHG